MQVKPIYRIIHSQHHEIGSAITALGTAFGDAADIGLCFVAFHLALGLYIYCRPSWNLAAVVLLIMFEVHTALTSANWFASNLPSFCVCVCVVCVGPYLPDKLFAVSGTD